MATVDPSIALGFQMPQFMNPMQAQSQMMNLKALQQQAQARDIEIKQGQQTLKDQQELSAIAADRENIDPATGGLTAEALTKLTNPMLRQKLNQDRMGTLQKAQEIKIKTSEAAERDESRKSKTIHDLMEQSYAAYEKNAQNPEVALQNMRATMKEGFDDIAASGKGGFSKEQIDGIANKWLQAPPDRIFSTITTHKERNEEAARKEQGDRSKETPFIKETNYLKSLEGKLADLAPNDPAAAAMRKQIGDVKAHIAKLDHVAGPADTPKYSNIQQGPQGQFIGLNKANGKMEVIPAGEGVVGSKSKEGLTVADKMNPVMLATVKLDVTEGRKALDFMREAGLDSGSPFYADEHGSGAASRFVKKLISPEKMQEFDVYANKLGQAIASAQSMGRGQISDSKVREAQKAIPVAGDSKHIRDVKMKQLDAFFGYVDDVLKTPLKAGAHTASDEQKDVNDFSNLWK